jgi:hypothetical protein
VTRSATDTALAANTQRSRRSHAIRSHRAVQQIAISAIATCALAITGTGTSSATVLPVTIQSNSSTKPAPGNLIVGEPIKLPAALFVAGTQGSSSLITPSQARIVTTAMWNAWQSALYISDTRALTQLATPGPVLNGTIDNCAFPNGQCIIGTQQKATMGQTEVAVPYQRSYPLYFLASILTTTEVSTPSGLNQREPWMSLQVLTKASSGASWRLSFDSGYAAPGGGVPAFIPFDEFTDTTSTPGVTVSYNATPSNVPPVSADDFLPLLASYYQSFKSEGHAPAHTLFIRSGMTSGEGQELAQNRQGSVYNGERQTYRFVSDARVGTWQFTAGGGYPMECGSVLDDATITPVSGFFNQNSDETNYGIPLRPGLYSRITTDAEHEVCVYVATGGLTVGGGGGVYSAAITGTRVAATGSDKHAPAVLADLETTFGVLASEMGQYDKQYSTCLSARKTSCLTVFAQNAAQQFAAFDGSLDGFDFPARLSTDVSTMDSTTRKLTGLYGGLDESNGTARIRSEISKSENAFLKEYKDLIGALSSG